ncbi:MAG: ATP-dependent Clp protease ATP-binding subunit [Actinobacteria bacterium]|nr:ATP-dependent Clp protease ATP-binding subunit [Actinomycetota bacterium]
MICQSCKRRPATMAADILVDGKVTTLKLCGLCAHRVQMRSSWDEKGWRPPERKTHFTQDLSAPFPADTQTVVFTAITKRGQKVMEWAERESRQFGLEGIASSAILISLLTEEKSASYQILSEMGIDLDKAFRALHEAMKSQSAGSRRGEPLSARVLLSQAQRKASEFDDKVVEPEHIMLALLDGEKSLATEILLKLGVNIKELKARLLYYLECQRMERDMRGSAPIFRQMTPLEQVLTDKPLDGSILHFFARDLVQEARERDFDPSVGRAELVERMIRVMCRQRRNNPLLIGDSGVGKTYLVEALAQRVAHGEVPALLQGISIAELDTVALMEGASVQGELEKRVKLLAREMSSYPDGFILFIPYIQHMLGEEGRISGVSLNTILQPILEKPRLWCIATANYKNYENLIAPDENLSEAFQKIVVDELSPESTRELLANLRSHYESFHNVRIEDEALDAAVHLSDRYLTGLRLPDKAIDLIDEAAAHVAVESETGQGGEVTAERVAEVVTMSTGIPAKSLLEEESARLLGMEQELSRRVIGQERAIKVVSETVRRSRAGLSDQKRPIGTFLFLGSTGVGKTEVAKSLAEFLFGDERSMVRLDMSEFSEKHSVAKLIGSPPGYVGYEEGGQLTSAVSEKPYSVILLDEIEKAHPAIFNLLLQLMDEGRLTDSRGQTVNFRNTIVIMTSNIAGEMINSLHLADTSPGGGLDMDALDMIMEKVKEHFSMEFINRINEIVVFNPLSTDVIERIVEIKVASVTKQMKAKGLGLLLEEPARSLLARKGFSREFGARYLERTIQKELSNPLSDLILKGEAKRGDEVRVDAEGDALTFGVNAAAS